MSTAHGVAGWTRSGSGSQYHMRLGQETSGTSDSKHQGRDRLWWHPMLEGHGVRAEEADMSTQVVMAINQMLRLMSPQASKGLLAVLTEFLLMNHVRMTQNSPEENAELW